MNQVGGKRRWFSSYMLFIGSVDTTMVRIMKSARLYLADNEIRQNHAGCYLTDGEKHPTPHSQQVQHTTFTPRRFTSDAHTTQVHIQRPYPAGSHPTSTPRRFTSNVNTTQVHIQRFHPAGSTHNAHTPQVQTDFIIRLEKSPRISLSAQQTEGLYNYTTL